MPQGRSCDRLGHGLAPEGNQGDRRLPESNTPAAWRAEYSPRLRPAAHLGTMPSSCSRAVTPAAKATMQGWVYRVWDSVLLRSLKAQFFQVKVHRRMSRICRKAG